MRKVKYRVYQIQALAPVESDQRAVKARVSSTGKPWEALRGWLYGQGLSGCRVVREGATAARAEADGIPMFRAVEMR